VFCFIASEAIAQNVCGPREELVLRLWNKWQEAQIAHGLVNDGRLVEVFVSKEGSWTILISDPNGRSCAASAGKNWMVFEPVIPKEKTL